MRPRNALNGSWSCSRPNSPPNVTKLRLSASAKKRRCELVLLIMREKNHIANFLIPAGSAYTRVGRPEYGKPIVIQKNPEIIGRKEAGSPRPFKARGTSHRSFWRNPLQALSRFRLGRVTTEDRAGKEAKAFYGAAPDKRFPIPAADLS